jgi:tetratricopeptide (TPR) repeat protein
MLELSVRFTAKNESAPISATLSCPELGTATAPRRFKPPLQDTVQADLRWYLEVFSGWPTGPDYERAEGLEARLEEWGRALRDSIFSTPKAARLWQQFIDTKSDSKLVTIDATDPRVLRLPWELLADAGGHIFARGIGVRRRLEQEVTGAVKPFELPVRVLVVVSRPDDAGFFDPRGDALPLLDVLEAMGARAEAEFLYPPTLDALTKRLRDRQAPPVHVVHFDGHGVYDAALGLGYLLFEDDQHKIDRVDANRLGTLLFDCGVPLMVLSACQSAKQEETNPYASVAARLIRAGVGSVLAMNYTVLVVAARKFVAAFYGGLASGLTVGRAVDEGRVALLADDKRHTLTRRDEAGKLVEETIHLRDWFLPALYQQAADPVVFSPTPLPPREGSGVGSVGLPRTLTEPNAPGGLPAEPLHGFRGRAREMLRLERALADKAVVVLHGFGGMGKTALAAEAGRWFYRTGRFPGGAAFVSFEHGGSLDQLCSWVGQAVSGDPDFAIGEGDPVQRVAGLLGERPALVILDNFESVLGRAPLMPPDELKAVLDAVWTWAAPHPQPLSQGERGGRAVGARLLITTRDTTFNDARFGPSRQCAHVELGGLEQADALDLAAAVLDDHGIDRTAVDRQALADLMDRLGGHPLSLYLALPHLRQYTPAQLSAHFEELLPGFVEGKARERNESLAVSLEFSLRRLGEATRAALPDLAVFQGGCMEGQMLIVTEMPPAAWEEAKTELVQSALMSIDDAVSLTTKLPDGAQYISHFMRFHPTLAPYLATKLSIERRQTLEDRYWQAYYRLANDLYHADTKTPHAARAIALRELPNLLRALDLALAAASSSLSSREEAGGAAVAAVGLANRIGSFLDKFGRWRERDALLEKISTLQSQISSEKGIARAESQMLIQRGEAWLTQGRAAEVKRLFRDLLARLETGAAYNAAYDHAYVLWDLGRCLAAQGQPTQAIEWHRQALGEFELLSASNASAKNMMAMCLCEWARSLVEIGRFDEAQNRFEAALPVFQEMEDLRSVGVTLGQLGTLALRRGDLAEARQRYAEALQTFRALGEPQSEAVAWHQFGRVAEEAEEWDEAERCYRESLKLKESYNDLPGAARTCNQLAVVAAGAGRHADAERWYLRALEGFEQTGQVQYAAVASSNLASLYLDLGRLDKAEHYAHRAVEIDKAIGDPSIEIWKDYANLARIAEARGQADKAAGWRRKEQESYAAYAGATHEMRQYQPLIQKVVAACRGNEEAHEWVEGEFPKMEAGGEEWARGATTIRRILTGERDADKLYIGLNRGTAYIVRAILTLLAEPALSEAEGEAPSTPGPREASRGGARGPSEIEEEEDRVARVREQWAPVVGAVAAACRGNADAAAQVAPFLEQLAGQEDWRALAAVLRRILAGERDPQALLPGLDDVDTLIAGDVLRELGVAISPLPLGEGQGGEGAEGQGINLGQLLALVAQAGRPDAPPGLAEQLFGLTRAMSSAPEAPPEVRALGRVLNRVLSGDRAPDLSGLPPELADAVRAIL